MCLLRFLAGVSAAFTTPQVWAAIPSLYPQDRVPRMMGIAYAGLAASQAFGVPIGSGLAQVRWPLPFFAIGLFSLLLAVCVQLLVPDIKPRMAAGARRSPLRRYVPLLTSARGRGGFLGYFLIHLGSNAAFAFLGKWLTVRFGLSVGQIGYVIIALGLGNLLGSLLSGGFARRLGPVRTTTFALLFLAGLYVALPHVPSAWAVGAAYLILFTALGILFPLVVAMLNALNASIRGTISSLATSTMNAATTVAPGPAAICSRRRAVTAQSACSPLPACSRRWRRWSTAACCAPKPSRLRALAGKKRSNGCDRLRQKLIWVLNTNILCRMDS
jgi:predicted MFS family arabinose efflux permease